MQTNIGKLTQFIDESPTAYHAAENAKALLISEGFIPLAEQEDWNLCQDGKYFVQRGTCIIAFTVGGLDNFCYKIVASHVDSPALKLKENPVIRSGACATLNVETYGGGLWYSFMDRPLKIAGRVVKSENSKVFSQTVVAPFLVTIPSVAIHQNRNANDGFTVNPQIDLCPLLGLGDGENFIQKVAGENVLSYDLFVVSAEKPYSMGMQDELLAAPRIDNLTSAYASLQALLSHAESDGICIAALFDCEEVGSRGAQGAGGDFLENTLRRIAYALRFDDNEFYKALASSFLLSVDNAHAAHPNHPEKSDPTNKTTLGGGVAIKSHAGGCYLSDGLSSAMVKTVFDKAGVKHQSFFNRSDARSGSTLGMISLTRFGVIGADIGLPQLAMHSACECFAKDDYTQLETGLTAFYSSDILADGNGFIIR